jgi:DNA-binding transcriptional LysR family regulator
MFDASLLAPLYDVLTVARMTSVAEAAKRLGKTPSAVSQQIRRVHDAFGVSFFEHRGRGLLLTPEGEQALPALTRLFDDAEGLYRLLTGLSGSGTTTLRLAVSDYLGKGLLVPVLLDLSERKEPLHFVITTAHSAGAIRLLDRGEVDMAVVSGPRAPSSLRSELLFEQPFFWVGPRHPDRRASLLDRLAAEPVLRLSAGSFGRQLLDACLTRGDILPVSTIDVPSVSLLLSYAKGGVGIGLVPGVALLGEEEAPLAIEKADVPRGRVELVVRVAGGTPCVVERFVERVRAEGKVLEARMGRIDGGPGLATGSTAPARPTGG